MSADWNTDPTRRAVEVWICGSCDSHLIETREGLRCETCGDLYDDVGRLIPEDEDA